MERDWVNEAQNIIVDGSGMLNKALPTYIKRIIKEEVWRERKDSEGVTFDGRGFKCFVEYMLPYGLETEWDQMKRYCQHKSDVYSLLLEMDPVGGHGGKRGGAGRPAKRVDDKGINQGDNVTLNKRDRGNSKDYIIARLKRDAATDPKAREALQLLEAGKVSARKAGIHAGFIKPADPALIVEKQVAAMEPEELIDVYRNLTRSLPESHWDYLEAAKEAVRNLNDAEFRKFTAWLKSERNQKKAA